MRLEIQRVGPLGNILFQIPMRGNEKRVWQLSGRRLRKFQIPMRGNEIESLG